MLVQKDWLCLLYIQHISKNGKIDCEKCSTESDQPDKIPRVWSSETFLKAAHLMDCSLYKSKTLPYLKLIGRGLVCSIYNWNFF